MPSTPAKRGEQLGILVVPGCEITRKKLSQCGNLVDERGVACMSNSDIHQTIADRYGVGRVLRQMMLKNCFTGRDRRLEIVWQQYSFPLDCAALGSCKSPGLRFIGCKPFARIIRDPHERQHYGDFDQHADDRGHRRAGP